MRWKLPALVALAVVVVLAGGGALAGLVIGGAAGAMVGAAAGGLAGVAAGYVPVFQDRARQRREGLEQAAARQAEARRRLAAASEPKLDGDMPGPSLLLRPERAVVGFTGREAELAALRTWCASGEARSVRVIAGAGGVGKTRLALQIAAEWEGARREWVLVAAGAEAGVLERAREATAGPVLLVVDYAETRAGLGVLLRAVLDDPGPVRVLLLARSLGEWWERLAEESAPAVARLLAAASPVVLDDPVADLQDADLAAAAVPFFAAARGVPVPAGVSFDLPPHRVPVLVLHTAALVAVLRSETSPPGPMRVAVTEGVLGELLEHEARYWRRTAAACGLPDDGQVLKALVTAAVLLGAGDLEEAAAVAGRVPDLAGAPVGDLRRLGRWLYGLYPGGPGGQLGSVQPDLLAEHHAATQLAADPALARSVLAGLDAGQARRALTVLARAWELHEDTGEVIETALLADVAGLAIAVMDVAIQTQARMAALLVSVLRDAPASLEDLIRIKEAIPYPSVVVASADLAVTQRIRRELPPGTAKQDIARWADAYGTALSQTGRLADALRATQEAVGIRRELAAAMPARYRPDLATSLSNLGIRFGELGRPGDALLAEQEAADIRRELAEAMPARYRPDLATSLSDLGVTFSQLGRPAAALPPMEEAVAIRRQLAAAMPDRYDSGLPSSLLNLGATLADLGHLDDALPIQQEAVALYRDLAAALPDRYRLGLARSLHNLGVTVSDMGHPADALPPVQEAITILRELALALPDRYRPELANSLSGLGDVLSALGRNSEAAAARREAEEYR